MAFGDYQLKRSRCYRDLESLVDYRECDGDWTLWFEDHWLKPRLHELGDEHARFFGGKTCEYDGSFRERVCEVKRPGRAVEYYTYG